MGSYNDYNWEMTGPPDQVTVATNPGAVESYNNFVEAGGGGPGAQPVGGGGGDNAAAVVEQMYQEVLGRAPDAAGQAAFVEAINNGADIGALAASMAASAEAQQRGITQQASAAANQIANLGGAYVQQASAIQANKDYVTNLYYGVFGRAPDAAGLANNVALLNQGKIDPSSLAASFANSPEAQKDGIPAAQQQQIAQQIAGNYGAASSNRKIDTATGDWSGVSAADLVKAGITNPAILAAAATGQLNDNIFGSFKTDANIVANAMNAGVQVPSATTSVLNSSKNITGAPSGQIIGKSADASGGVVYHYSNGGSVLYDASGVPISMTLGKDAYRQASKSGDAASMAVADNPGVALFNGKLVTVSTPHLQWNPSTNSIQNTSGGTPMAYREPSSSGLGADLANFDKSVRDTVPGGWMTVAMLAAAAATMGAGSFLAAAGEGSTLIAADAAALAAEGLSATQISQTLAMSYGLDAATATAIGSGAVNTIAAGGITAAQVAALGGDAAAIAAGGAGATSSIPSFITSALSNLPAMGEIAGIGPMVQGAVVGGTLGAGSAAITGNNVLKGALGGIAGGLTGGAVSGLASGFGATGAGILGGMSGGAVTSAINGAPILSGVLGGGVAGGLGGYLNGPGTNSLLSGNNQLASQVYGGMAGGAVNAAVQGGNILTGAIGGAAFGGLANALVNATMPIADYLGGEATPGVKEIPPERQQAFAKAAATIIQNPETGTTTYIFPDNTSLVYNNATGQVINTQANGGNYTAGNGLNGTEFGKFYLLNENGTLMTNSAGNAVEAPSSVKVGTGFSGGIGGGTVNGIGQIDYAARPGYTQYGDGTNGTTMGQLYYTNPKGEFLTLPDASGVQQPVSVNSQFGSMTAVAPQGTVYGNPSVPGGGDYGKNYISGPNGLPAIDPYGNLIETGKAMVSGIPGTNLTPAQISGLIASQNAGGQIGKNGLTNFLKSNQATTTGTQYTYTAPKLPTLTGGLASPGLNPGWMNQGVKPFYATNSPVQSQYYWGGHPYMPDFQSLVNYNNVPNAPTTPWGLQQMSAPLTSYLPQGYVAPQPPVATMAPQTTTPIMPATMPATMPAVATGVNPNAGILPINPADDSRMVAPVVDPLAPVIAPATMI